MPLDSDDLERRDLEREAQMERLEKLEAWHAEQPGIDRLMLRVAALEARCHELEHGRAKGVQSQIADLQERVGALEQQARQPAQMMGESREAHIEAILQAVRQAPVDDHRDTERPGQMMVQCPNSGCKFLCGSGNNNHRTPHVYRTECGEECQYTGARCQPVPASPVAAIPDVPTPVGTEAFRRVLAGHMQELSGGYCWSADHLPDGIHGIEYLERLAGVACTLRDAYELARCGEQEQADEKLREIEW